MSCIVADAGPLIALAKLRLLDLPAQLFGEAILPETVFGECKAEVRSADSLERYGYYITDALRIRVLAFAGESP